MSLSANKANAFADAPTAIAEQFGVTAKALRLYEKLGLIQPQRTQAGWRAYGQADIERLAVIVALKRLGLPLKRIQELLAGRVSIDGALALQEAALADTQARAQEALALVRQARARLAAKQTLTTNELATLIRSTNVSEFKWSAKMDKLAKKHYSPEQLNNLASRNFSAADQERVSKAWSEVYAEIAALGTAPDITSAAALEIGRKAKALIDEFTQGDPAMLKSLTSMRHDMAQESSGSTHQEGGPMGSPDGNKVLGLILAELREKE